MLYFSAVYLNIINHVYWSSLRLSVYICLLADTTDDHTLLWLLNHIRLGIPELIIQIRHHKHTRMHAFFVTATYEK